MILNDDEYAALQALQQRMLDEALEQGRATLGDAAVAAIAARLGVVARIDAVLEASTAALADDDEDAEQMEEDDGDLPDEEPVDAARRLSRE
jgi:hypothetical protein